MDFLARTFFCAGADWVAVPLGAEDAPSLQTFLDANPLYSQIVNARPFGPAEALEELTELPPYPHTAVHNMAVLARGSGQWLGFVSVVDDLIAPGVHHIGLFLMATAAHGTGLAQSVYDALEARARASGARWMRLGVVLGNARAEAFWARQGFVELRQRDGMPYEGPSKSVSVRVKPLGEADWPLYLALVQRDQPGSP
jgi:GNAT superfamily N-acetyltransferase